MSSIMELKTYLKKNAVKVPVLAKRLDITKQHLYEILRGISFPSRKLAHRIKKETNGVVTLRDLFPDDAA